MHYATKYGIPDWTDATGRRLIWLDGPSPPPGLLERWRVVVLFPDGDLGREQECDRFQALHLLCTLIGQDNGVLAIAEAMRDGRATVAHRGLAAILERVA